MMCLLRLHLLMLPTTRRGSVPRFVETLQEFLQTISAEALSVDGKEVEEEPPDTGILVGWAITCEWMGSDGERWVTYGRGSETSRAYAKGLLMDHLDALRG